MVQDSSKFKRDTLNIGGARSYANTWNISDQVVMFKFVSKLPDNAIGLYDPTTNCAYCRNKQSRIETFRTFIHEMLHALEDVNDFEIPHEYIDKLEIPLSDFIIDNSVSLGNILFPQKQ